MAGEAEAHGVEFKTVCPGNVDSELLNRAKTRGINAQGVLDMLPEKMPADKAAVVIVDGLSKKGHKIIFPWYARLLYFIQRLWPEFGHIGARASMDKLRKARDDGASQN